MSKIIQTNVKPLSTVKMVFKTEIELQEKDDIISTLRAELSSKPTVVETKPTLSESKAFKLEIADRMMKLAGLDEVSDISSN
jgi:hypothetical protein